MTPRQVGILTTAAAAARPTRDEAVELLFRAHYPRLVRLAYCVLGDRGASEDAVQDAFVSLHRHWHSLRDVGAAESYLHATVLNRARSRIRDVARSRGDCPLQSVKPSVAPEEAAVSHDDAARLAAAVRELPRRQCEVVICRYYLQLSEAETAELLGMGVGSVKSHAHRALKSLSHRLEVSA